MLLALRWVRVKKNAKPRFKGPSPKKSTKMSQYIVPNGVIGSIVNVLTNVVVAQQQQHRRPHRCRVHTQFYLTWINWMVFVGPAFDIHNRFHLLSKEC